MGVLQYCNNALRYGKVGQIDFRGFGREDVGKPTFKELRVFAVG